MKLCKITDNKILASKGPYKHKIKEMVQSSPLGFYGLEQEREDLIQLKKDLDYWLGFLQNLLKGDCPGWDSSARFLLLQDSEFKVREFKFLYGRTGRKPQPRIRRKVQLSFEEMRRRVAHLVKDLRDLWIVSSIKYAERVAMSSTSMGQRRQRCIGLMEF